MGLKSSFEPPIPDNYYYAPRTKKTRKAFPPSKDKGFPYKNYTYQNGVESKLEKSDPNWPECPEHCPSPGELKYMVMKCNVICRHTFFSTTEEYKPQPCIEKIRKL
jgi:hypothetical protein